MSSERGKLPDTYATWQGMPVFLNVASGGTKTSLFCTIIGESEDTVRVRIADQWDVDIYKKMVQAVDAFPHTAMDPAPYNAGEFNQTARSSQLPATANVQPSIGDD